jgi:hypothetical protein
LEISIEESTILGVVAFNSSFRFGPSSLSLFDLGSPSGTLKVTTIFSFPSSFLFTNYLFRKDNVNLGLGLSDVYSIESFFSIVLSFYVGVANNNEVYFALGSMEEFE